MADENDILRGFPNRCTATKTIWLKFLFITATHLFQPQAPKGLKVCVQNPKTILKEDLGRRENVLEEC